MLNWKEMSETPPEIWDIIIIAQEGDREDRSKWLIGQFLQSDNKEFYGVLVDFDENGVDIALRADKIKYWSPLLEGGYKLPPDYKNEELPAFYGVFRKLMLSYEHRFIAMAKLSKTAKDKIYPLDEYLDGIYNRSLSLMDATITLLDNKNYMAAAHMVRLHLDNFLRLHAAWLVNKPHQFVLEVMNGASIRKMKDSDGKLMFDSHLVNKASEDYPWIEEVYDKSCGFIHLSATHIFSGKSVIDKEEMTVGTFIGKSDWNKVTDLNRIELIAVMIEISDCILQYAYGWARTKMQEDDLDKLKFKV